MAKQFGLIIPGQRKKPVIAPKAREISRPSIFDESSDSDDSPLAAPLPKMKSAPMAPGAMERRIARRQQEEALQEDPTIFQYDELYDAMETKREDEKQSKSNDPRKPKYIARLMAYAEKRKLENERRIERQVQKEREEEGEEFKDKEAFVTTAYRKKLEELKQLEEQEKRDEYLEAIGDVTKQKDLDGFYRHLYEQKLGPTKEVKKPEIATPAPEEEIAYTPIKSMKMQQRAYRKRQSSDEEEDVSAEAAKKAHLQNNMDADSDFSIDSSTDEESEREENREKSVKKNPAKKTVDGAKNKEEVTDKKNTVDNQIDPNTIALKLENIKKETETETKHEDEKKEPPKKDKSDIWKKRTVGDIFDAAVKRYFERKATRNA